MDHSFDVIVVGGGPGGSTASTLLAQRGYKVALFEQNKYPHFKIGESLLPYSMDILRKSKVAPLVESGRYIYKYGAQFLDYREDEQIYFEFAEGLDRDHPYAFEVPRNQFDQDLLEHAQKTGVHVFQPEKIQKFVLDDSSVEVLTDSSTYNAQFIVDASGREALLGHALQLRQAHKDFNHIAIFTHYRNVSRQKDQTEGDILIGVLPDQNWSWHIPFKGNITSVGIVCQGKDYKASKDKEVFIESRLKRQPSLWQKMAASERVEPLRVISNYSHSCQKMIGSRWILIGDAACFLDPVFSSGVHISLKSAELADQVIHQALTQGRLLHQTPLGGGYEKDLRKGIERFRALLQMFYQTPFVSTMKKAMNREQVRRAFTSAVGGDMWNDNNPLFRLGVLGTAPSRHSELSL